MRVTLLSCGPSLNLYDPAKDTNDLVVAVNRAAEYAPCDWWVMLDQETLWFNGNPRRGVMTSVAIVNKVIGHKNFDQYWQSGWEHMVIPRCNGIPGKTFPQALWTIASEIKPERIDVYGVDMDGAEDFTGETVDVRWNNDQRVRRSDFRWDKERAYVLEQFKRYPVTWHRPSGDVVFDGNYNQSEQPSGMPRRVERIRLPRKMPNEGETHGEAKDTGASPGGEVADRPDLQKGV